MAYTSRNPFSLLDESDPAPVAAPVKKTPAVVAAPKVAAAKAPRAENGRGAPRKFFQGDREVNSEVPTAGEESKEDRANAFGARGGARGGRGGARGGRGGANPRSNGGTYLGGDRPRRENGGGRPFDKHSQTAHKDSDKAEAQGWGADEGKKELEAEVLGEADAKVEGDAPVAAKKADAPAYGTFVAEEEEEDNTQTYEEYLAEQAAKKVQRDLPAARTANEGADDSQWKDAVALARKGEASQEWFLGTQKTETAKVKKVKDTKTYIEITANFKPPRRDGPAREGGDRGRGGRGGRGRGEGRGGRGGARGESAPRGAAPRAPRAAAVNVNDAAAFPTLA